MHRRSSGRFDLHPWLVATTVCLLVLAGCAAPPEAELPEPELEEPGRAPGDLELAFDEALEALQRRHGFPGATAAFLLPHGALGSAATGLADVEEGLVMTPDNRMPSGSIGKTFVAATALALAGDGRLDLDAPIARFLGDEPWFDRLPQGDEIRVRHLLNHSSGLPDHVRVEEFAVAARERFSGSPDSRFTPEELIAFVLDREPLFAPGEGFGYTDTGYILLGLIVEEAAGRPYYEELEARFLDPLGLDATTPSDRMAQPRLAAGYTAEDNPFGLAAKTASGGTFAFHPGTEWTGGGLVTNPRDLVVWARALYEGQAMTGEYLPTLLGDLAPADDRGARYGHGVRIHETSLGPAWGHTGWFPGWTSAMLYFPDHRLAVAIQVNTDQRTDPGSWAVELAALLVERLGAEAAA